MLFASITGFFIWLVLGQIYVTSMWLNVPICFYNNAQFKIDAPEHIAVKLKGTRSTLFNFQKDAIAVHIDAQGLKVGENRIPITPDNLLINPNIIATDYNPSYLIINLSTI